MPHPFAVVPPLLLSLWALPASGAAAMTLPEAIERAVATHPTLRAAAAEVEATRAQEAQARSFPNPALSLQAAELPLADPARGNLLAGVSVPLPIGGMRAARAELARLETAVAEAEAADRRRELVSQVKLAYAQVLHHAEGLGLARAAHADAERLLRAAEARYRSGDVPRVEVHRAEVERNRAERDRRVAESHAALSERRLALLIGQPAGESLTVEPLPVPTGDLPPLSTLLERMRVARAELRRAELAIAHEEQQRALARSSVWEGTEISVAGGLAEGQPAVSTALSVPLPLNRNQAEIAAAEARIRQATARRDAARLQLELELELAYREAAIAMTRHRLVAEVDLPQARRFADNARRRYLAGEGSGHEALDALRTLREVETEHLQTLLDTRTALARLEETVGTELSP